MNNDPRRAQLNICQHEGGTGCPETSGGVHYFAHVDPQYDGQICIDCGEREAQS